MEIEIKEEKKVPLFSRTEISGRISFQGPTPNRDKVIEQLAKKIKANPTLIVINKISTEFGSPEAGLFAYVYDNIEKLELYKPKMGKKALEKINSKTEKSEKTKKGEDQKKNK